MPKKIIQVPFDEELLAGVDRLSKSNGQARAELIREACRQYLRRVERDRMDRVYQKGYEKTPEKPDLGKAQEKLLDEVLEEENW
jgi:metal-responsive CopG/Arc/MetJ family transcriptional regulator